MKNITALITLLLLMSLCACGGSQGSSEQDFAPADLSARLLDGECFTDLMSEIDNAIAFEIYGIDSSKIESASIYMGTGATAEEIAVIKAKDSDSAKTVTEAMNSRVGAQIEAYKNYVPTEVPKLEEAIVRSAGNYVVYVTAADSGAAESIIGEYIK